MNGRPQPLARAAQAPQPHSGGSGKVDYRDYLPAIYRADHGGEPEFFVNFLGAFAEILTGAGETDAPGIEEILDGIPGAMAGVERYFNPVAGVTAGPTGTPDPSLFCAPEDFLHWLAGWVALELRADFTVEQKRDFIANAVRLYRLRGTNEGLSEYLAIYVGNGAKIQVEDFQAPFQLGVNSQLDDSGQSLRIGGAPPYYFRVTVPIMAPESPPGSRFADRESLPLEMRRTYEVARSIIDQQKPAHCWYTLVIVTPQFQVGVTSTVGVDTLLGNPATQSGD